MSDYSVVLGLQSTADWSDSNYIPGDYREAILRWYPNGEAPLTAMLSKLPSEVTDHYRFDWWTEGLPTQGAAITELYHDALLATAYTEGDGSAGDVVYAKFATEAVTKEFRAGHQVMLRDNSIPGAECTGKVLSISLNGASSYVAIKLLEADDAGLSHDFDYLLIIGSINPQASESVDAISYQPVNDYNYCQIWRTALEIAGTTLATKTRVGDWYQHEKQNALRMHSIEMEKSILWGVRYLGTGSNGKPEYTTYGMIRKIATNTGYYATDTSYAGKTWIQGGKDWLDSKLSTIFKYGGDTRMVYAGVGAILGLNRLAEQYGTIQLRPGTAEYGIKVMEWITPFGVIYLKRHPLFSYETADNYSMVLFEPKNMKYRYMKGRDTHFRPDDRLKKGTWTDKDAIKEGWLTEGGVEMHIEPTFGYFRGVGQDNTV
jgi:hypothetical protein